MAPSSQSPPPSYSAFPYSGGAERAPPLPPRPSTIHIADHHDPSLTAMVSQDPRSSSTQSLVPASEDRAGRRRLLLVYVHGFMGDETSFRNFPAHVHNLVTITLAESHIVHTKIYPKYRSRYALEVARDDFSNWLAPHEDQWTDVILLAHSMGGLVTAEVALLCRHRIIGTINFDVPFVGMHPGIVKAGLGSIFKPWPTPEERIQEQDLTGAKPSRMNTLFNPKPSDPNFNPSFDNDVHLPVRKGWENTLHWLTKHSNGLVAATKGLVQSHIEFGSAMADYHTLKTRYAKIRALEEDDIHKRRTAVPEMPFPPRLRFVNYYTASTGRPKIPKTPKSLSPSRSTSEGLHPEASAAIPQSESLPSPGSSSQAPIVSPKISVEHHTEDAVVPVSPQLPLSATSSAMQPPLLDLSTESTSRPELPEIPPIPQEPAFVDLAQYDDKAQRKVAEKEHKQALKDYQQAVKARNKVIKERSKIEEKWKKQLQKDQVHAEKDQSSNPTADADESDALEDGVEALDLEQNSFDGALNHSPYGNYDFSRSAVMNQPEPSREASVTTASTSQSTYTDSTYSLTNSDSKVTQPESDAPAKKKRLRKFCMLPPKDGRGNKDPTWVRVFMENIDEVTAHTTLFFVNDTYEQLVGDVGARIEDWVCEADSLRVAREMDGME